MLAPSVTNARDVVENSTSQDEITCQVARSRADRVSAFRLLHDGYVANDLMASNRFSMRVTPWQVLPTSQIYVAKQGNEILYTMSLVPDSRQGLPLEELYVDEMQELRESQTSLAEVTCLTSSKKYESRVMFNIFVDVVALMFQQARSLAIDGLVIAIHPRHVKFYERELGFRQVGPERTYSMVDDKPAVMCYHDFSALDTAKYPLYERIYAARFTPDQLAPATMPDRERELLAPIIDATVGQKCMTGC